MGEGEQDVERQAPHAGGGIELLGDRYEGHTVGIEQVDDLGEVPKRSRQAVDLVDHYDIDTAILDIGEQPLERRAVHVATGESAIIVAMVDGDPPFMPLAGDERQRGIVLSLQAVVFLVEAFVGGLACVDRAAPFRCEGRTCSGRFHTFPFFRSRWEGFRPKNTGPE